jgi:hypothetical protein
MVRTYMARRTERESELELAQEALAMAPDEPTARSLEQRIVRETEAVENIDFVMGEHIARMTALRAELPGRLKILQRKRALVKLQRKQFREGLRLLASLRGPAGPRRGR